MKIELILEEAKIRVINMVDDHCWGSYTGPIR